jgi:hypothetical protein
MTNEEKAYIAGIIDGEGSIMLQKFHSNQLPSPCVSIASTTIELLEWISLKINSGAITKKKNYNSEKHKDSYTLVVRYNNAIELLNEVEPYLVIQAKKLRAKLILEKYKSLTPRNGRYSSELIEAKNKFYNEFINIK